MITNNPKIEIWKKKYALITDDTHFTPWAKQHGSIAFHHHITRYSKYIPKGGVVVDGGANQGMYTAAFCELVGEEGHVYSFEPNELPFICLAINAPSAHRYMMALGDRLGRCNIMENKNNYGASYIKLGGHIPITPLDYFLLDRCDLIKLDIEGFEISALKGARETIAKHKPVLVLEVATGNLKRFNLTPADVYSYIDSINYKVIETWGEEPQQDIICLPK